MNIITDKSKPSNSTIILHNLLNELGYNSIIQFQSENGLKVDGQFGLVSFKVLYNKLLNVINVPFEGYYHKTQFPKKQIIWHHSAGWDNARGMFESWARDNMEHVATAIGINDKGEIYRGFDESYWASSIGCKQQVFSQFGIKPIRATINGKVYTNNSMLDAQAIGVEICNAGQLFEKNGKLVSWFNWQVPEDKIIEVNYKGYKYFEKYTDDEIKALKYWTLLMGIRFDIPVDYNEDRMWTVNKKALSGEVGVYTHNSYREDKADVSPQEHLIKMAIELNDYMK